MSGDTLTVYADYACPFCYLGRTSLTRYREARDAPLAVEWHPFDLLSDRRDDAGALVEAPAKDDDYYERAWRNVERLAAEYDVDVPDGPITDVDSLPAQQVSLYVTEHHPADWPDLDAALYDAVWRDERDVGDPDALAAVAVDAGLGPAVVERALADDELRSRLRERFAAARASGVTAVPTFVHGDRAARGAVPPADLRRLVEGAD